MKKNEEYQQFQNGKNKRMMIIEKNRKQQLANSESEANSPTLNISNEGLEKFDSQTLHSKAFDVKYEEFMKLPTQKQHENKGEK